MLTDHSVDVQGLQHRWPGSTLADHSVDVQGFRSPAAHSDLSSALSSQRGLYSWSCEGGNLETWNLLLFIVLYFPFLYREANWGPMNVIIPLPSTHWLFGLPRRRNTYLETCACSAPSSIFLVELGSFYWSQLVNRKIQCFYVFPTLIAWIQFKVWKKKKCGVFGGSFLLY